MTFALRNWVWWFFTFFRFIIINLLWIFILSIFKHFFLVTWNLQLQKLWRLPIRAQTFYLVLMLWILLLIGLLFLVTIFVIICESFLIWKTESLLKCQIIILGRSYLGSFALIFSIISLLYLSSSLIGLLILFDASQKHRLVQVVVKMLI